MKKVAIIILGTLALASCRQTGTGDNDAPNHVSETATPDERNSTGTENGTGNQSDTVVQDTSNDASKKPKPRNEVTPPEVTRP